MLSDRVAGSPQCIRSSSVVSFCLLPHAYSFGSSSQPSWLNARHEILVFHLYEPRLPGDGLGANAILKGAAS